MTTSNVSREPNGAALQDEKAQKNCPCFFLSDGGICRTCGAHHELVEEQDVDYDRSFWMVTTGTWTPGLKDTAFIAVDTEDSFETLVDGPYSTFEVAQQAADRRVAPTIETLLGDFEPHGTGIWLRHIACHMPSGDREGWQEITLRGLDVLP